MLTISLISLLLPLIAYAGVHIPGALYRLLDVRGEANVPTLFATFQLALASILTLVIGRAEWNSNRTQASYWFGLAPIFAYLAIDETAQLHEAFALLHIAGPSGLFLFPDWVWPDWIWIVLYGTATAIVGALYMPFLLRLPMRVAAGFLFGGAVFVVGALGLETIGLLQTRVQMLPQDHLLVSLRANLEELCEMTGILIFIWGALCYLGRSRIGVTFAFTERQGKSEEP